MTPKDPLQEKVLSDFREKFICNHFADEPCSCKGFLKFKQAEEIALFILSVIEKVREETIKGVEKDSDWEKEFDELWKELLDWAGSGFRFGDASFTSEGLKVMKPKFHSLLQKRDEWWIGKIEKMIGEDDVIKPTDLVDLVGLQKKTVNKFRSELRQRLKELKEKI